MNTTKMNEALLMMALEEDLSDKFCDVTTDVLFSDDETPQRGEVISKSAEDIVICGIEWTRFLFSKLSDVSKVHSRYEDGNILPSGDTLLSVDADAKTLLKGERTALNFLRHLCAIATLTRKYVTTVAETDMKILDTRKTTPGFRMLEKYAVHCGGGENHRMGLYDAVMIKDTHIDLLGGMKETLEKLPYLNQHTLPVIVEVRSIDELDVVMNKGKEKVHRVLLDNMSLEQMSEAVKLCKGMFETEASGNIRLDKILAVAKTGVDYASIGELTYGAGHVDLSMRSVAQS